MKTQKMQSGTDAAVKALQAAYARAQANHEASKRVTLEAFQEENRLKAAINALMGGTTQAVRRQKPGLDVSKPDAAPGENPTQRQKVIEAIVQELKKAQSSEEDGLVRFTPIMNAVRNRLHTDAPVIYRALHKAAKRGIIESVKRAQPDLNGQVLYVRLAGQTGQGAGV